VEKPQNKDTDKLRDMHGLWPFTYGTTVPAEPPHKDARSFIQRLLS